MVWVAPQQGSMGRDVRVVMDSLSKELSRVAGTVLTDHGTLGGLADDDHPQYALSAGDTYTNTHTFSGTLVGSGTATMSGTLNASGVLQRNGSTARMLVDAQSVRATANITTTTTPTLVTGATVTLSLTSGDLVTVTGVLDIGANGAGTCTGDLYIGGVAQTGSVVFTTAATGYRSTVAQTWVYSAGSTGSVTFELRASHSAGSTAFTVRANHTSLLVSVYR